MSIQQTMAQKILASHAGLDEAGVGRIINAKVDWVLANELSGVLAIQEMRKAGIEGVFDKDRIILVPDHFTPNKDIKAAELAKIFRDFARSHNITNYFEIGRMGIEHVLIPEQGLTAPGELIIGGDSHTCTYGGLNAFATGVGSTDVAAAFALGEVWLRVPSSIKVDFTGKLKGWASAKDVILTLIGVLGVDGAVYKALEFGGDGVAGLGMSERLTIANMAIEAGAKAGIFPADETTKTYLSGRAERRWSAVAPDEGAEYDGAVEIDLSQVVPVVAKPSLPENVVPVKDLEETTIDQVLIGACTNGRLEDLRLAAKILSGRKTHPNVRVIVLPGTQSVYKEALNEGIISVLIEAECAVSTPTCGACVGGHMGVLAEGETCVSTTNRNFVGRMGHPGSKVYLASPATAAASALAGKITTPDELGI
jgi:3-isopropylmalate/(R)-2-methylmalate dehydratase large subunit